MSSTPREIGTLIVVVLKANHLPNKRHIGKQDPYCVVSVNGEKRRTKAIRRGGQHPEWDEEIRFTLFEDTNDTSEKIALGDSTPPPPPPKDHKAPKNIKGGKKMKLSCFADDTREPDFIGEADVDLTEVLTKGETDEWFTLTNKDKFAGKVYLELTFWSNEPPPEKKVTPKPSKSKQYGGPGSFIPTGDLPPSANGYPHPSRIVSYDHSRHSSDSIPPSLRASSSLANLDLYVPPYEQAHRMSAVAHITNELGEFGLSDPHRRRDSFPPLHNTLRPSSPSSYPSLPSHPSHGFNPSLSDSTSTYSNDYPNDRSSIHQRSSVSSSHYTMQPAYHPQYETGPLSTYQPPPSRGPRHSVPASSSGFMPMPIPQVSGFIPMASHPSGSALLASSLSHPSLNTGYNSPQFNPQPTYQPVPSQTPAPTSTDGYIPIAPSASFHSQQSFPYSQYASATPGSVLPHGYVVPPTPAPAAPSQTYQGFAPAPSPSHDGISAPPSGYSPGSRPLPQEPQVVYQQTHPQYSLPLSSSSSHQLNLYGPAQPGDVAFTASSGYVPPPPPPPPPQLGASASTQQTHVTTAAGPPPPPPPPPQVIPQTSSRPRRSSLPVPPVNYQQQSYQHPPPPPPPPPEHFTHSQPLPPPPPPPPLPPPPSDHLSNSNAFYHPGPPPKPPALPDSQGQWVPPNLVDSVHVQQGYH